jgi:RNA polymerase sigma-70 factor, ECF subfamily
VTPEAFETVYRRDIGAVWAFLHRLGLRPPQLEELAHDVFATAWRRRTEFDDTRDAKPWLFGIAFRCAANHRSLASTSREQLTDELPDSAALVVDLDAKMDAERVLGKALGAMSFEVRTVFVLHELEERPIPEVANVMGTPVGTAYTRLRAARQVLELVVAGLETQQ